MPQECFSTLQLKPYWLCITTVGLKHVLIKLTEAKLQCIPAATVFENKIQKQLYISLFAESEKTLIAISDTCILLCEFFE